VESGIIIVGSLCASPQRGFGLGYFFLRQLRIEHKFAGIGRWRLEPGRFYEMGRGFLESPLEEVHSQREMGEGVFGVPVNSLLIEGMWIRVCGQSRPPEIQQGELSGSA